VYRRAVINGPERACLAIADVSGYTGYLAGVELDHAQDILADLISTIVGAMAPFQLSKLEGDAAFTYLIGDDIDGSMLQDTMEGTYVAFRQRLRNIQQASSCECNACVRIPSLDLKFVVHHGHIARQQMLGNEELVGADVILIHRLLKNRVIEDTGVRAYALYTQATLDAAGVDAQEQGLVEHREETDIAGEVVGWVRDLEAHWQSELDRPRQKIAPDALLREYSWNVATPPSVTFDYLTSPQLRQQWDTTITRFDEKLEGGRRGIGTTNHCMHGEQAIDEEILEWRPPHYWMLRGWAMFIPGQPSVHLSDELEPTPDGGTRVISRVGKLDDPTVGPELLAALDAELQKQMQVSNERLRQVLGDVAAEARSKPSTDLPESAGRHLQAEAR
jgi:uncharacterized protein YndB with AHSA1/START domain